jgi:hypothetical protein
MTVRSIDALERLLTSKLSSNIIALLTEKRRWSIARIARTINASREFVQRVHAGKQSLLPRNLQLLAKACRQTPHELAFDAIGHRDLPDDLRELHEATRQLIDGHKTFQRTLLRRKHPVARRRGAKPRTKAA